MREGTPVKRLKLDGDHQDSPRAVRMLQQERRALPIFPARRRLIQEVLKHGMVIIIGETGSGKTTQIPQYLHEDRLDSQGIIAITQPRRVAAITMARRVADEMNTGVGELVGYTVRFEDVTSYSTKLKYLTDGMLLREAMLDPLLQRYTIIILDEAHERTVHTDVLFGIVKNAYIVRRQQQLRPLKVIIMSATMDVDHFQSYFNSAPVLFIEGRQYPVEIFYTKKQQEDYVYCTLVTLFQIHKEAPASHDILVFLTGQEEIEAMVHSIKSIAQDLKGSAPSIKVYPLYASLPSHQQLEAFNPAPADARKVVLSTNIAETSVTIDGIKNVIDSGMVKARTYQPGSGLDLLKVQRISKAQAWQRTGRAGRQSEGSCYRAYTKEEYKNMVKSTIPEIQRCSLTSLVLQLLTIGIKDVLSFDFMDKPPRESILSALQQLHLLGAINTVDNPCLTTTGLCMAQFPLDPKLTKVILESKELGCTEEVLTVIALLSGDSILVTPLNKREEVLAVRQKFVSSEGDHIMLLNIYRAFRSVKQNKRWCYENFVNARQLNNAVKIRAQLAELCMRAKIPLKSCGQKTELVRKCLTTGLFMNMAELQRDGQYLTLDTRQTVAIHPSSVLFRCKPSYVIFSELVQTGRCYIRQLSVVDIDWLVDVAPEYSRQHRVTRGKF